MREILYICDMIEKLLLTIQGYKKIDQLSGLWKHSYTATNGKDVVLMSYANYDIYYNSRKNFYKLYTSGFLPMKHMLSSRVRIILEALNYNTVDFDFTNTAQDWFLEKEVMMRMLSGNYRLVGETSDGNLEAIILGFDLTQTKEFVMKYKDSSEYMVNILKTFIESDAFPKSAEIYEKIDNIVITSEGYYVATYKKELEKLNDEEEN